MYVVRCQVHRVILLLSITVLGYCPPWKLDFHHCFIIKRCIRR